MADKKYTDADGKPKKAVATRNLWVGNDLLYREGEEVPLELVDKWGWKDHVISADSEKADELREESRVGTFGIIKQEGGIVGKPSSAHNENVKVDNSPEAGKTAEPRVEKPNEKK